MIRSPNLRVALAQLDFVVGDIAGNRDRVMEAAARARDELEADLVVFPELALTGYPPEDLLLRPGLHRRVREALHTLREDVRGIHLLIGFPLPEHGELYNACAVIRDGETLLTYRKRQLPNYSVFDEKRYFAPGEATPGVFELRGMRLAVSICEDIWVPGTVPLAREAGAQVLLNINASPFHLGKHALREEVLRRNVHEGSLPIVYLNLVGGQDELVFDGASMVMDAGGRVVFRAPYCREALAVVELETRAEGVVARPGELAELPGEEQSAYEALVLGIRDYVDKNGFPGAIVGLSGGIDSALTLALAADALGPARVQALLMPSRYTSQMSLDDARAETQALGVVSHVVPIDPMVSTFDEALAEVFAGSARDATEENIQARCRGIILMAVSNKKGSIVLATGNKSEMSVGYATLYGDMAGGFAPLKDVAKLLVYRLAEWRNQRAPVIPGRVLERPPSAELAPDQRDEDSLPPYAVLDPILERYIERRQTPREITAAGFDARVVERVTRMVDRAEYKRRQAAPGVRITERAFGKDRRYPITSRYTELSNPE